MSVKVPISTFVGELTAACDRKDGYIMGSLGNNPKTGYIDLSETKVKSSWKPDGWYYGGQYSGKQLTQALYWREHCLRVWDCNGMAEGIYEIHTGISINSKARFNYRDWCDPKGKGTIPAQYRVKGAAVFWSNSDASSIHHVGYLEKPVDATKPYDDWYIIEAKGVMYGVVRSKLSVRKPNFWGIMSKHYDYDTVEELHLGDRILSKGCCGNDVKELQEILIEKGYSVGKYGADGDFGTSTKTAVISYQENNGLKADGIVGDETVKSLKEEPAPEPKPVPSEGDITITGNSVWLWSGHPSYGGSKAVVVHKDDKLQSVNEDNYFPVVYDDTVYWVNTKYIAR